MEHQAPEQDQEQGQGPAQEEEQEQAPSLGERTLQAQQYAMVTELFEGVDFVRLRNGRAYLHAADDGRSVCLDRRAASRNAVWAVTLDLCESTATTHVLLRGAYGRYLGAPDATVGCSCLPTCRAAAQRDRHGQQVLALLWRPCPTTRQGVFRLCDPSGRYLRANPGCLLPPCRRGVSVSACAGAYRGLGKAIQWVFEPVPRGARPLLQRTPESLWSRLFAHVPLSGLCMRWFSGREIRWQRADESGDFSEDNWRSTRFTGRHTILLERQLVGLLPREIGSHPQYTVCVRAGLNGLPTPLAIDLPRSREPLHVVLFAYTATAEDRFIYPDLNAAANPPLMTNRTADPPLRLPRTLS